MKTVEKIIELLNKNGISGAKMSRDLGFSNAVFSQWKSGKQKPSAEKLSLIADYFHVSLDYLLDKDDNIKVYDEHDNLVVLDDETREIIDSLRSRPEMKILFSVSKKATKEDIIQAVKIIEALKGDE